MFLKLAWKNLWRNKKRTIIVSASIFTAVITACIMRSAQLGSYSYMIESSARMQTGYLQVQGQGFWENRSMDKSILFSKTQLDSFTAIPGITSMTPRLEAFALLSNDTITKVAPLVGIDPLSEQNMTGLETKIIAGAYLLPDDRGIMLAEGLARRLRCTIGDSLILYGSGYHGQIAAAYLEIKGIVKLALPLMNNAFAFISLANAQDIFAAPGRITSLSIMLDDIQQLETVIEQSKPVLAANQTLMRWDEMMPELLQSIQIDNASGLIMIGILYMVIGFGVLGTIMMMTTEREKEFGILFSVGMERKKMILVSIFESIFISVIGVIIGVLLSIPITQYFKQHPIRFSGEAAKAWEALGIEAIMPFSNDLSIFFWQALIVFIIALICAIYPVFFISALNPVTAMRK